MNCFAAFFRKKEIVSTLAESRLASEEYIYEIEQDLKRKATHIQTLEVEVNALKLEFHTHRLFGKRNAAIRLDPEDKNRTRLDPEDKTRTRKLTTVPFNVAVLDRKVLELNSARYQYELVHAELSRAGDLLNATEESIRALRTQQEVARVSHVLQARGITKKQVEVIDKNVDHLSDARDNVLNANEALREIQTVEPDLINERSEAIERELQDIDLIEEEEEIDISSLPVPPKPKRIAAEEYA